MVRRGRSPGGRGSQGDGRRRGLGRPLGKGVRGEVDCALAGWRLDMSLDERVACYTGWLRLQNGAMNHEGEGTRTRDHYVDSVKGLARTAYGAAGSVRVKRPGWLSGRLTGAMQGSLGRWERLGAGGPDPCWSSGTRALRAERQPITFGDASGRPTVYTDYIEIAHTSCSLWFVYTVCAGLSMYVLQSSCYSGGVCSQGVDKPCVRRQPRDGKSHAHCP